MYYVFSTMAAPIGLNKIVSVAWIFGVKLVDKYNGGKA